MKKIRLSLVLLVTGCTPIVEYQHISHSTQHFEHGAPIRGFNMIGGGVRLQPAENVSIDLIEHYSFQKMHNRHEVFVGRVTIELK